MSETIKNVTINQTPQDICATLGWATGAVVTVQNKSTATLKITQDVAQPEASTKDCIYLPPYKSITTQEGDAALWVWSSSNEEIAVIKRS